MKSKTFLKIVNGIVFFIMSFFNIQFITKDLVSGKLEINDLNLDVKEMYAAAWDYAHHTLDPLNKTGPMGSDPFYCEIPEGFDCTDFGALEWGFLS